MQQSKLITVIAILFCSFSLNAQRMDTSTKIIDTSFRTLQVKLLGNDLHPPIINLESDDQIRISFDEISEDIQYLRYSLVHCNANWQPSPLVESEYIDGFNLGNIEDYSFSSGTFTHYVHYELLLPNENMRITKSGNYLLCIYSEDDSDTILLQARFSVCEGYANVASSVTSRTDIDYNSRSQQLSAIVTTRNYVIQNMFSDLIIYASQNNRPDNEVLVTRPLSADRAKAVFDHNRELIFPAGNEYRRFEVVSTNYPGMRVESMEYHQPFYHANLYTDIPRNEETYSYDQTQYGRYTIRESNATNSDVAADYVIVHFSLKTPQMFGGKLYINGDFTQNRFTPSTMMKYNPSTGVYELDMMLKQGAYNYQYLWVPDGSSVGYTEPIEGNHYQTVNEYLVKVYHRAQGERYDRFIGYGMCFSGR